MGIREWIVEKLSPAKATQTQGTAGLIDSGGFVQEAGRRVTSNTLRRYREIDEMLSNAAIVAAGLRMYLNVLSKAEWTVNPAEDQEKNAQAQEIADNVYDMMYDMTTPWANMVRKLSLFKWYGFSVMEWTAKRRDDGLIGMADVGNRPQRTIERWQTDPKTGTIIGCYQQVGGKVIPLPREKLVYAVDDSLSESPEGLGLFSNLLYVVKKLSAYTALEEIGFETDLRGFPIAYAPLAEIEAAKAEHAIRTPDGKDDGGAAWRLAMTKAPRDFITNHIVSRQQGAVLDSSTYKSQTDAGGSPGSVRKYSFELLQGDSRSFTDVANAINRDTEAAARIMGIEHLLLGQGGDGSLALSKTKQGNFYLVITSVLSDIVEILERDWLGPLVELNGWPAELVPSLAVEAISESDLDQITNALLKMAQAGAPLMPDDPVVGEVRDMMGLSRPVEDTMSMQLDATLRGLDLAANAPDPSQQPDPNAPPQEVAKRARVREWITSNRAKRRVAKRSAA